MGVHDQTKSFFQDIAAPEIHALRSDIRRIDEKIDTVDASVANKSDPRGAQVGHTKCELIAEIRRVD
jgi:hypothetical protein